MNAEVRKVLERAKAKKARSRNTNSNEHDTFYLDEETSFDCEPYDIRGDNTKCKLF